MERRSLRPRNTKRKNWSDEDESQMDLDLMIFEFESGVLKDCPNGITLKAYLSRKIDLSDLVIADLIGQGIDFNLPYCHFGNISSASNVSVTIESPKAKRKSTIVNVVSPPSANRRNKGSSSSSSSTAASSAEQLPTQVNYFDYSWEPTEADSNCSLYQFSGVYEITPTPFVADPDKLLTIKLMMMDEQERIEREANMRVAHDLVRGQSVKKQWFKK